MPKHPPTWREGSFLDNFAAAVDALGFDQAGIAWGIAKVQFESVNDRERFLNQLVAKHPADVEVREKGMLQ